MKSYLLTLILLSAFLLSASICSILQLFMSYYDAGQEARAGATLEECYLADDQAEVHTNLLKMSANRES